MTVISLNSICKHLGGSLFHVPGGKVLFCYRDYSVVVGPSYDFNLFTYELYVQKLLIDQMKSQTTIVWC